MEGGRSGWAGRAAAGGGREGSGRGSPRAVAHHRPTSGGTRQQTPPRDATIKGEVAVGWEKKTAAQMDLTRQAESQPAARSPPVAAAARSTCRSLSAPAPSARPPSHSPRVLQRVWSACVDGCARVRRRRSAAMAEPVAESAQPPRRRSRSSRRAAAPAVARPTAAASAQGAPSCICVLSVRW